MPTVTRAIAAGTDDYWANQTGFFGTGQFITVGTFDSTSVDAQGAFRFSGLSIPRYSTIDSLVFQAVINESVPSSSVMEVALEAGVNPTASTDTSLRDRTLTTARVSWSFSGGESSGSKTSPQLKALLQEQVNKGDLTAFILRIRDSDRANTTVNRRLRWHSFEHASGNLPSVTISYTPPATTVAVSGQIVSKQTAIRRTVMKGNLPVEPVTGGIASGRTALRSTTMKAQRILEAQNTAFTFLADLPDTHHLVTETGEVVGFAARVPTLLGGIRNEMLGALDDAWYPASGLLTRTPAPLEFEAALLHRDQPRLERDRLIARLKDARALYLPDGRVFDLWGAQAAGDPANDYAVNVSASPKGAEPRHVLLSGSVGAAFETYDSNPQVPVYAVDPAGGIRAPILPTSVPRGALCFAVRSAERGVEGYASVGRPVEADGSSHPSSVTVSLQDGGLELSLFGFRSRFLERLIGIYGAVLVCYLFWRESYAHLVTVSSIGVRHFDLPIGTATTLSERVITAGVRADGRGFGGFIAPGAASLDAPFFSLAVPTEGKAEQGAVALYKELTRPGRSWAVLPPDISLVMTRASEKALELAPGESMTFALNVRRVGGYTGALEFAVKVDTLTSSWTVAQSGDTDTYTVTLTAPTGTPEAAYTLRATVKAAGADNEGSILKDVRDVYDAVVQVAAGPAIAANATGLYFAHDPVQMRDAEMLKDSSGNANDLFWGGYARPNREFTALLATGVYGAHLRSETLANAAQAQRMGANQTHSFIFGEVEKTKNGAMFMVAADNSENGVHLMRVTGGFKLRTVNGASTVTSPDTLSYSGGRFRPMLIIDTAQITLVNRDGGASISVARPAWPDAGVRTSMGALRTTAGALSELTRVYCYARNVHPYALSDIARRRNMDALQAYAPTGDGKGEFPDNAIVIALWESALGTYRNLAAPALGITLVPVGGVTTIPGGIAIDNGSASHVYSNTGVPSSEVVTLLTTILDFNLGTAYGSQIGLMDSAANAGNVTLTKHENNQAFPMASLTDLSHVYKAVGPKLGSGKASFKSCVFNTGKSHELTELQANQKVTVTGNVTWTGTHVLALGVIRRSGGGYQDKSNTRNLGTIMVRGELSSDDLVTSKALLSA